MWCTNWVEMRYLWLTLVFNLPLAVLEIFGAVLGDCWFAVVFL